jgi:acid stress chaperone HdeB
MIRVLAVAGFAAAFVFQIAQSRAQVTLDVSKITCNQFAAYKITSPRNIAIWLSGYYNGKRDNTIIDMQELMEDTQKLQDYCILHPETRVMQAVEVLFVK